VDAVTPVGRADVERAAERVAGYVRRTPVIEAEPGLWLKLETLQHTGSFKARGAFNRILSAREAGLLPDSGVIAASGGNHGLAVAYAARALGVRAEIFVPVITSPVKVAGLRALGAEIVQVGAIYSEALEASAKRAAETGALQIHAYDQPAVVAGAGTAGLEILEQTGGVDTILVAVGGGGLIAGVTAAVAGRAQVVAVEPELIPTLHDALAAGHPVPVDVSGVAADALGATRAGHIAVEVTAAAGVRSLLVSDDAIIAARRELWRSYRVATEHAGATALAALLSGAYRRSPDERVAVLVCGANTDPATLA
jgi:threonine dehydratase